MGLNACKKYRKNRRLCDLCTYTDRHTEARGSSPRTSTDFSELKIWTEEFDFRCRETGCVTIVFGRKFHIPTCKDSNPACRKYEAVGVMGPCAEITSIRSAVTIVLRGPAPEHPAEDVTAVTRWALLPW